MRVFERGWLSANNILFLDEEGGALVDSGYVSHAAQTVALVEAALAGRPLTRLINTHLHSDHCGGNAALQRRWPARTWIPHAEAPAVAQWNEAALSFRATGQQCDRFRFDATLEPGQSFRLGGVEWRVETAPGHDPHAVMLFAPAHRLLISGDALWENGFGVIFPELEGQSGFAEQAAVLDRIAQLEPALVIPGHGKPFDDVAAALERARSRLAYLRTDPRRNASHGVRVLVKFKLLAQREIGRGELLRWMQDADLIEHVRQRYFGDMAPPAWLDTILAALVKAGAAAVDGDTVRNVE